MFLSSIIFRYVQRLEELKERGKREIQVRSLKKMINRVQESPFELFFSSIPLFTMDF